MYIEKVKEGFYYVKQGGYEIGEFSLVDIEEGLVQLQKLQVTDQVSPGQILGIFELIQSYAKEEGLQQIHVKSHSKSLDHILQHQQFKLVDVEKGLWIYDVINSDV